MVTAAGAVALDAGGEEGGGDIGGRERATLIASYHALPTGSEVMSRAAKTTNAWTSRTLTRWSCGDPIIERLPQGLEHTRFALRELIEEEDAMVGQRHLARHWHMAVADQPRIRQ